MHIGTRKIKINITDIKDLIKVSKQIVKHIKIHETYLFYGQLGVGKTTLIKNIINLLQKKYKKKKTEITSPTFNIINEYKVKHFAIMHCDLYRIKKKNELNEIGIYENRINLRFIEWPERFKKSYSDIINLRMHYNNNYKGRYLIISTSNKKKKIN